MDDRILFLVVLVCFPCKTVVHAGCSEKAECPAGCACDSNVVDCRERHLDHVPKMTVEIKTLLLSGNKITEIRQYDFTGCTQLRTLDVSNNRIQKIPRNSFRDMGKLSKLYLQHNHLNLSDHNSSLPTGLFDTLGSLTELNIHDNDWSGTFQYRDDLVRNKPVLEALSLDSPPGLVKLPRVFSELKRLRKLAVHGGMSGLKNDTLSALVTVPLKEVSFNGGKVQFVEGLALSHLQSITSLDLSNNLKLGLGSRLQPAWYGLRNTTIEKLYLQSVCIFSTPDPTPPVEENFFNYLSETPLAELYLDHNGISRISAKFLVSLPRLQKLSLSYNSIFDYIIPLFNDIYRMQHISYLDISMQSIFPEPGATSRRFKRDSDWYSYFLFPPHLRTLNVSRGVPMLDMLTPKVYLYTETTYFDVFDLSHNTLRSMEQGIYVIPRHPLHISYLNFSSCEFHRIVFASAQLTVETLDFANNNLGEECSRNKNGLFLAQTVMTTNASVMILSGNGIKDLEADFFSNSSLLQRVYLANNALRVWKSSLIQMPNISHLDLSDNLLPSLTREVTAELEDIATIRNFSLNLRGNSLICSCYTLYFLEWMRATKVNIVDRVSYVCDMNNENHTLSNITDTISRLNIQCASRTWAIVTGVMTGVLVLSLVVLRVLYRYRWDVKYACLKLRRQRKEDRKANNETTYQFDAFVAYHQKDIDWVLHGLIPVLEQSPHFLRLCIHHRNWLPGPTIEENISRSVEESRKTLVILSNNFIQSGWCELELQLARMRGLDEGEDIIIVVALEDIPMREMNRTLANLRRSNSWLDWFEYENDPAQFWRLLAGALSNSRNHSMHRHGTGSSDEDDPLLEI